MRIFAIETFLTVVIIVADNEDEARSIFHENIPGNIHNMKEINNNIKGVVHEVYFG